MKAIMVMFDSLNRRLLPPYGCDWVEAPNFTRLAGCTATFDTCYAGSLPCMPARRELHTGRHNFLHRSWGPLEPFDDSVPELLRAKGVYTHLATDHQHYWEDGGATYHYRFNTFEFYRGQEGDPWKGHVADPDTPKDLKAMRHALWRQDWINRSYLADEADHPQTRTFDAGLHFIDTNRDADNWFVQIETFDPHEPFFSYPRHKGLYPHPYEGPHFDWPDYKQVLESPDQVAHLRYEYAALLSMCDASLGRVLDTMDAHDMWDDTMLIVCTDHGFLLGEHGWWGKAVPPWFDETVHTPLFIWDPRSRVSGERRRSLVQTIDIGPTLLDLFGVPPTPDMQGASLADTVATDQPVRAAGLFGAFGGHVSVTDGRYVYMRAPAGPENQPLIEHTLMPTHMRGRFSPAELRGLRLGEPLPFSKGVPVLEVDGHVMTNPYVFGTLLFDLATDPDQATPLIDDEVELRMVGLLVDRLRASDAPREQYQRLGLPSDGAVSAEHLQIRAQWPQVESSTQPPALPGEFPIGPRTVNAALSELMDDPSAAAVLRRHLPAGVTDGMARMAGTMTVVDVAAIAIGVLPRALLEAISTELSELSIPPDQATADADQHRT